MRTVTTLKNAARAAVLGTALIALVALTHPVIRAFD